MRRLLKLGFLIWLGIGVRELVRESRGEITCTCADDCWCKVPGLSLFRWVFPFGHHDLGAE